MHIYAESDLNILCDLRVMTTDGTDKRTHAVITIVPTGRAIVHHSKDK